MIGLSYKTDNANIKTIAYSLKAILSEIQSASCPLIRTQFSQNKQQLIDGLSAALNNNSVTCADITTSSTVNSPISKYADSMTASIKTQVPSANADKLKQYFTTMIQTVLVAMCTDNKVDLAKVDQFLNDILNAICY
jgi:hypothetical protein